MELQSPLNPWGFRALLMATWRQLNKNDFQHLKSITAGLKAKHCVFLCSGLSVVFSSISSISPALSNSVQTCQEIQLRRLENADARGDSSDHLAQCPPCFYLFVYLFLTDEDTEAQRGKVTCPRLHSQQASVSKLVSVSIQEGVK